jgi:hypothetical protein
VRHDRPGGECDEPPGCWDMPVHVPEGGHGAMRKPESLRFAICKHVRHERRDVHTRGPW